MSKTTEIDTSILQTQELPIYNAQLFYLLEKFRDILHLISPGKEIAYQESATRGKGSDNFFEDDSTVRHWNFMEDKTTHHRVKFSFLEG